MVNFTFDNLLSLDGLILSYLCNIGFGVLVEILWISHMAILQELFFTLNRYERYTHFVSDKLLASLKAGPKDLHE